MSNTLPKPGTSKSSTAFNAIAMGDFDISDLELALFRELLDDIIKDDRCPPIIACESHSLRVSVQPGVERDQA